MGVFDTNMNDTWNYDYIMGTPSGNPTDVMDDSDAEVNDTDSEIDVYHISKNELPNVNGRVIGIEISAIFKGKIVGKSLIFRTRDTGCLFEKHKIINGELKFFKSGASDSYDCEVEETIESYKHDKTYISQ